MHGRGWLGAEAAPPPEAANERMAWAAAVLEMVGMRGRAEVCRSAASPPVGSTGRMIEPATDRPSIVFYNLTNAGASAVVPILSEILGARGYDLFAGPHLTPLFPLVSEGVSPIFHWTHSAVESFSRQLADPRFLFVCLHRDPRDVLVSHVKDVLHGGADPDRSERDTLLKYIRSDFAGMFAAADEWLALEHPRVRKVSFEQMKRDIPAFVRSVLEAARVAVSDEVVGEVCQRHSFERVTGRERGVVGPTVRTGYMYRKGISGDWKNCFDAALAGEFADHFGEYLRRWGYAADRSWVEAARLHPWGPQPFPLLLGTTRQGGCVLLYGERFHGLGRECSAWPLERLSVETLSELAERGQYVTGDSLAAVCAALGESARTVESA